MLRLSQVTIGKLSIGHIVNLASNDVQRFDLVRASHTYQCSHVTYRCTCTVRGFFLLFQAFVFLPYLVISPLHVIVVTYLIYVEVGWTAFLTTGFIVLQVPLQIVLAKIFAYFR